MDPSRPLPPELSPHPHHVFRIGILNWMCRLKLALGRHFSPSSFSLGLPQTLIKSSIINGSDVEQTRWVSGASFPNKYALIVSLKLKGWYMTEEEKIITVIKDCGFAKRAAENLETVGTPSCLGSRLLLLFISPYSLASCDGSGRAWEWGLRLHRSRL